MSRRNTFPSLSSSRQMMMAWKVSGLSHRPAIIASRPASMRLAMAISPSRDRQLHRAHFAQIHAHRIIRALGRLLGLGLGRDLLLDLDQLAALALGLFVGLLARLLPLRRLAPSLLGSSVSTTLTPISLNIASTSSICSELTSSEGNTELIWSWVT